MNRLLAAGCLLATTAAIAWVVWSDREVVPPTPPRPSAGAESDLARGTAPAPEGVAPPRQPVAVAPPVPTPATAGSPSQGHDVVLTGILLFQTGDPMAGARCSWSIQGTDRSVAGTATTDADGRFHLPGPVGIAGAVRMLRIRAVPEAEDAAWSYAETALAPAYPPGRNDIGFLGVETLPLLASGRVVDAAGTDRGFTVHALPAQIDFTTLTDEGLVERLSDITGEQGRFAIYGRISGNTFSLAARRPGRFQVRPITASVGDRDITIEVAAAGALAGSLRLGPGLSGQSFTVELAGPPVVGHLGALAVSPLPSARPLLEGQPLQVPVAADGSFEVDGLRPGTVDLTVRCEGLTEPVAHIEHVEIRAGEPARDERLRAIHLESLRSLRLAIVDDAGLPVARLAVGIRDVGTSRWQSRVSDARGLVAVVTAAGAIDVQVLQGGFREQLRTGIGGNETIAVQRGLPVAVVFELGDPVPGFEVTAQLVASAFADATSPEAGDVPASEVRVVDTGVPFDFCVPRPGAYRVVGVVRVRGGPKLHAWRVEDFEPAQIEVGAGTSRVQTVRLSGGAIAKAVSRIRHFVPSAGTVR